MKDPSVLSVRFLSVVHNFGVNSHLSKASLECMGGTVAGERLCSAAVHVVIDVVFSTPMRHLHVCSKVAKNSCVPMSDSVAVEVHPLFSVDVISDVIVVSSTNDAAATPSLGTINSPHLRRSSIHLRSPEKVVSGCELRAC